MQFLNATGMKAACTMGRRPDGRELLVVVVKGTFDFPARGGEVARLSGVQADLVMADEHSGEAGFSAPVRESEFCFFKRRCDVLLNGSAHAPEGRPTRRVQVGLRVGQLAKSFDVVGDRKWRSGLLGVSATEPALFTEMPISYDRAFGGTDQSHEDVKRHGACMENPVGRGFHVNPSTQSIEDKPLPNTEETGQPVTKPNGRYRPMAFGPVGRGWTPRLQLAGTYDQHWIDHVFPFLPGDFDDRHNQAAPDDQQIDYPMGGEDVVLVNLTPEGRIAFKLPQVDVPVTFYLKGGAEDRHRAVVDTVMIEPDSRRLTMVWRTSLLLKRDLFEVPLVVVGTMSRAWNRARRMGKAWYPSLEHLVNARRSGSVES